LVSKCGTIGRVKEVDIDYPFAIFVGIALLRPFEGLFVPKFLEFLLNSPVVASQFDENAPGSTRRTLALQGIRPVHVPVPPLAEQRRIVAKLEALLAKVDASRKRLERIPVILKRFRQAVLASACDGRLTEDWRIERQQNAVGDEGLPEGWLQVNVGMLLESLKYGTAAKCEYNQEGVAVLRIPNVSEGRIDTTDLKFAELSAKEIAALSLVVGDILMIRSNGSVSLVGRTALVEEGHQGLAYAGYLIRLRPNKEAVNPRFLNLALSSFKVRLKIELEARSTSGVNNINSEEVRELEILLPPLEEQTEIIHRLNDLFALADQIEARYTKAKAQVDRLTQSILAKTFRGELVLQDPNDEPAEVLLSRLGAASTQASAPAHRRGRPPRVQPAAPPVAPVAPTEDRETPALADLTLEAILQAHREILASIPSPLSEDNLLRAIALRLGFQRLGSRIKTKLQSVLLPEVRDERTPR